MNKTRRAIIIAAVLVAAVLAFAFKPQKAAEAGAPAVAAPGQPAVGAPTTPRPLPRLVDLGADKCIPCKMMAPILEELKKEYTGRMEVVFIDVWKNPAAGREYGIEVIPTQIFYDAQGKELARHVGFISKEDILKKWQELGVNFNQTAPSKP